MFKKEKKNEYFAHFHIYQGEIHIFQNKKHCLTASFGQNVFLRFFLNQICAPFIYQ